MYRSGHANRFVGSVFFIALLFVFSCCFASPTENKKLRESSYKEGELIVRFAPNANGLQRDMKEKLQILDSLGGGTIQMQSRLVPGLCLVKLPPGTSVKQIINNFKTKNGIDYAQPNFILWEFSAFPNDTFYDQLWGMNNIGQAHPKDGGGTISGTLDADIDAPEAWSMAQNSDIIVAVIDTGADYSHPDLVMNMWINETEFYGEPEVDDDGNYQYDDIYGTNYLVYGGDPMDDRFHGTHCAGIISANCNNVIGVTGVCWNNKIMALKFLDKWGSGSTSAAISCIEYSVEKGAKILSNSWGGRADELNDALKEAIEAAGEQGVLFIAAAGNYDWDLDDEDYPNIYPAFFDCNNIITVMATDSDDSKSSFSNYGLISVDLAAPGSDILSTFPSFLTDAMYQYKLLGYDLSTYYETISGTSMACPHVAGACALVWAANPTLTHLEVKQIILDTVDPLPALDGKCVTGGRLNLQKALAKAMPLEIKLLDDRSPTDCSIADPNIFYTITYANPSDPNYPGDATNCVIVLFLPAGIDPNFVVASDNGIYDPETNTVTWDIGTLSTGERDLVTLTVRMEEFTHPPLGRIWTKAVIYSDTLNPLASVEVTDLHPIQLTVDDGIGEEGVDVRGQVHYTLNWKYLWNDPNDPDASKTLIDPRKLRNPDEPNTRIHPDNLKIITYLPPELGPVYIGNEPNWVIVWEFDPNFLAGDRKDSVELTAPVNNLVVPDSYLTTRFKLFYTIDGIPRFAVQDVYTKVCACAETKIIYVDENAEGAEDGSSWQDAFIYLDEALEYARACGDQIWVAAGTYSPDGYADPNATFKLVNNVAVYGGFPADGGDWEDRNWLDNETILSGNIGGGILSVVTAENIDSSAILDGFTIKDGLVEGVLCTNASPTIRHNRIKANGWGIYCAGTDSAPLIKNNWIYQNEEDGIYLETGNEQTLIRNNTIADNAAYGICVEAGDSPDVRNCILWGHPDPNDVQGCATHYCIVQENEDENPDFLTGTENYHIDTDSPGVNAGDPNAYYGMERDIDGQFRVIGDTIDIGADEICLDSYFSPADFNADNIVNLDDYYVLAALWLDDSPPFDPNCDLNADQSIDVLDLALFTNDWLWFACAYHSPQPNLLPVRGGGEGFQAMSTQLLSTLTLLSSKTTTAASITNSALPEVKIITLKELVELIRWTEQLWLTHPEIRKHTTVEEWNDFLRRLYLTFDYLE